MFPNVSITYAEPVNTQLFASVIVYEYVPAPSPVMSSVVAELDQANVNGVVPPTTVKSIEPFGPQTASTTTVDADIPLAVFPTEISPVTIEQPELSVTVHEYNPADKPVIVWVEPAFDQA